MYPSDAEMDSDTHLMPTYTIESNLTEPFYLSVWTNQHKAKVQMNAKAKYLLTCALSKSVNDEIISCDSAKEIWDRLQTLYD